MPELAESESGATADVSSIGVGAAGDVVLIDALSAVPGLSRDDVLPALSALGLACWSAHQTDDDGDDEDAAGEISDELNGAGVSREGI